MKISKVLVVIGAFLGLVSIEAEASSLDELYRDIIRSDNSGYLPLFVKNRNEQMIMLEEEDFKDVDVEELQQEHFAKKIKLSKPEDKESALLAAKQVQWLKTIAAIKSNQVTAVELHDITTRANENDPRAVEILAWMYTKGVGVSPDFVEAFNLYKKAAALKVANAEKNAFIVYKSMNDEQRRLVKNKK